MGVDDGQIYHRRINERKVLVSREFQATTTDRLLEHDKGSIKDLLPGRAASESSSSDGGKSCCGNYFGCY